MTSIFFIYENCMISIFCQPGASKLPQFLKILASQNHLFIFVVEIPHERGVFFSNLN